MLGLSPTQERIFIVLQHYREVRIIDLIAQVWRHGEPSDPANALSSHVWELNRRLRPQGFEVKCRRCRLEPYATSYQLFRLSTRPAHKDLDPQGLYIG